MENELDLLTKKYWGRFAIVALVNAAVFTTYRLYIHKLNKDAKNKSLKEKTDKINIPVKLMNEDESIFKKTVVEPKKTKSVKSSSNKNANVNNTKKETKIIEDKDTEKRTVGRPKRPARVAPHIQKEKK